MSLDLLDTPLRITWDLNSSAGAMAGALALKVADQLASGGVFFATLEETPLAHPAYRDVYARLKAGGCAVQVRYGSSPAERTALMAGCTADTILFDVSPYVAASGTGNETALREELRLLRGNDLEPVLLLSPTSATLPFLPRLLTLCRELGIGRIKLPNTRLDASFCRTGSVPLPTPADLEQLGAALRLDPALAAGLELEIHDLFLWELFQRPDAATGRSEYGGCQAANSLGHINCAGEVLACSSWPAVLGSLQQTTLDEIWAGAARLRVREAVAAVPAGCAGCRDYQSCFGGCRGLSATLDPSGDGRDLLCVGRRE